MAAPLNNTDLYNTISELDIVDRNQLDQIYQESQQNNLDLYTLLQQKDLLPDENLGKIVADMLSVPYIKLSNLTIPQDILEIVPEIVAKKNQLIAFGQDEKGLKLALSNPKDMEIQQFLEKKTGHPVRAYFATPKDISDALSLYKKDLQKSFDELLHQQVEEADKSESKEAPVSKIVDLLIEYAYINRASDIHIEPFTDHTLIRFRIDGILHDVLNLSRQLHDQIITRIKVLSKLRTDEHFSAQDGKMQVKMENEDLDIRVSIVPIISGEKAVLRLLSSRSRQFSLNDLGMSDKDLAKVKEGFNKPYGMVLSTGPTGSGKTTTIYAILKILNTRDRNIATIEDPVEYDIQGVNQIQVNPKTNLTFADGLRAILRQDPNVIFIGEIRDQETAAIATNSALTGHLVLSTLHTNNAATTLPRMIDMEIEPFLVASTVNVIIGQRLVRKICQQCRVSFTITNEELLTKLDPKLIQKHFGDKKEILIYHGKGCPICHSTGYNGRIGIFEVLTVTEEIRALIIAKANADEIEKKAVEQGMTTMLENGIDKVIGGITTLEEILAATKT